MGEVGAEEDSQAEVEDALSAYLKTCSTSGYTTYSRPSSSYTYYPSSGYNTSSNTGYNTGYVNPYSYNTGYNTGYVNPYSYNTGYNTSPYNYNTGSNTGYVNPYGTNTGTGSTIGLNGGYIRAPSTGR